ncbi:site-specific integrase [Larsenimonas rhizosphaerae]|uniref:site-specific integrase n=1 Tax=Larsenimonas rhizosphaerae TaxID=2944682 RepID=UPI002033CE3D|nr:hypothetical protein [Larsenimonas rhizosphaerae]MCM2131429.1 hypothetical protein [Larsenimonas rhizosphaerae]
MSKRLKPGKPRRHNPHIPQHIDQTRLPARVYFDHRGRGNWYVLYCDVAGKQKRQNIANIHTTLSELHRIMEERKGITRDTLRFVLGRFHESAQYKMLALKTRSDYDYCRDLVVEMPTRLGKPLGDVPLRHFKPALIQRLIDRIAGEGTPSKANHILRYLRRVFRWGINRGYCDTNPAQGVEAAKERQQRRLPDIDTMMTLVDFARERGKRVRGEKGACAPYLWIVMELAYLCRLRGIEIITLTDANATTQGILTNRRKGSRDNIVRWDTRLRAAWNAATQRRADIWRVKSRTAPSHPEERTLIVAADGEELRKSSLDTAWQRMIKLAIEEGVIPRELRFGLHDLKRRGITDTTGTRHDKQDASGHRSAAMLDVYDLSVPLVDSSGTERP